MTPVTRIPASRAASIAVTVEPPVLDLPILDFSRFDAVVMALDPAFGVAACNLGRILLEAGRVDEAVTWFERAIEVAHAQQARSWELRAATSLAQLRVQQRENAAAHATLAPVYNRFLEGFETQDLVIARAVLDEASAGS